MKDLNKKLSVVFNSKDFRFILLIIVISLVALFPLLNSGFFISDDGNWMVIRFSAFYQDFRNGQIPVRFLTRLYQNYGYMVANFNYPLFMYLGVPIKALGFTFTETIKIIFAGSFVASGIFSYLWLVTLFKRKAALISSVVYLFSAYHLFDFYSRGSLGEMLALAIVPFILWQIERKSIFWIAVGIASLMLSHNILALMFMPFIVLYMIIKSWNNFELIKVYLIPLVLGLLMSSFFWLVAIMELNNTVFRSVTVSDYSKYFADISLVITPLIILVAGIYVFLKKKINARSSYILIFNLTVLVISIFLSVSISSVIWEIMPSEFVQFPFRFISLTLVSGMFVLSFVITELKGISRKIFIIATLLIVFAQSLSYLKPEINYSEDAYYSTNMDSTTIKNEYLTKWLTIRPDSRYENLVESGGTEDLIDKGHFVVFSYRSDSDMAIRVNRIYYPGWRVYVNDKQQSDIISSEGLISVQVNKGMNNVKIVFKETNSRLIIDLISSVSFLVLIFISIKYKNYDKKN